MESVGKAATAPCVKTGREGQHNGGNAQATVGSSKGLSRLNGEDLTTARAGEFTALSNRESLQETADGYARVVVMLSPSLRVIECRDGIQWILQRRKKGGAERPWRGVGYFRTRKALRRVCATFNQEFNPGTAHVLDSLPEVFGRPGAEV
jgi:hypothetical protein